MKKTFLELNPPFLTVAQVAARLSCHRETVLRSIRRGDLKATHCFGYKIEPSDLDAYVEAHSTLRGT